MILGKAGELLIKIIARVELRRSQRENIFHNLSFLSYLITSTIYSMSYLKHTTVNPHIYLYAKRLYKNCESETDLKKVEYLTKTRMFDQLLEEAGKIKNMKFESLAKKLEKAKEETEKEKQKYQVDKIDNLLDILDVDCEDENIQIKIIDERQEKVYKLAKIIFDEGNYQRALEIIIRLERQTLNEELYIQSTWARLYCETALGKTNARRTAQRLRNKIDEFEEEENKYEGAHSKKKASLTKRHYAQKEQFLNLLPLIYFNEHTDEDYEKFLDICTHKSYFSVVQLVCPHLFPYICASMILNRTLQKNRAYDLFMLIETIKRKLINNDDGFSRFLTALYVEYDFELATKNLKELEKEMLEDPLLAPVAQKIIENCFILYYKVYCKIFERISIKKIAASIGKEVDEAELWILKLIRSLDIEAKIDSVELEVIAMKEEQGINEKYGDSIPKMNTLINNVVQAKSYKNQ